MATQLPTGTDLRLKIDSERRRSERGAIEGICGVIRSNEQLCEYAEAVHISIEERAVVLRGEVPSQSLKTMLVAAVRQAGILWQIKNSVRVAA